MTTLHETILAAKLDEVAKSYDYSGSKEFLQNGTTLKNHSRNIWQEASLLAMQEVEEFTHWKHSMQFVCVDEDFEGEKIYEQGLASPQIMESVLFTIWKGEQS